jgi:hypothetical protein
MLVNKCLDIPGPRSSRYNDLNPSARKYLDGEAFCARTLTNRKARRIAELFVV